MITLHQNAALSQQFFKTDEQHQILKEDIPSVQIVAQKDERGLLKVIVA